MIILNTCEIFSLVSYWICKVGEGVGDKYANVDNNCVIKDVIMIV